MAAIMVFEKWRILVHFREADVGEASEPEGVSSRSLHNDVTRALINKNSTLFIKKTI